MGGGGKSSTSSQTVSIPPEVLARYNAVNARAETAAATPFQQYGGEFVAPLNPTQQAGIQSTSDYSQAAQPYYGAATQGLLGAQQGGANYIGAATGAALAGAAPVNPGGLQTGRYMNPYTQSVVGATQAALGQQQGQQLAQQQSEAIKGGAFGGERAGLQRAQLMGQQSLAQAQAIAPLYQQGYQQALQTAQQQQGVGLGAAQANRQALQGLGTQLAGLGQQGYAMGAGTSQQLAGLGTGAQSAALQGAQAQIGAGTLQQQTQQAQDTAQYQQFLQERGYPFQTAQFLANIAEGTGALSGSTTTGTQPRGFFSNRGGFKTAAKKAYGGGLDPNSMGGAVYEPGAFERGGYATDGRVDPTDISAILAQQQKSFGPFAQQGLYGGASSGMPIGSGGAGVVPQQQMHVPKLVTAGPMPRQAPGAGADLAKVYSLGDEAAKGMTGKGLTQRFGESAFGKNATAAVKDESGKVISPAQPETKGFIGGMFGGDKTKTVSEADAGTARPATQDELDALKGTGPFARGGGIMPRHHYADGGAEDSQADEAIPYDPSDVTSGKDPMESVLTAGSQKHEMLKPANLGGGGGGGGGSKLGLGKMAGSMIGSAFGPLGSMAGGMLGGLLPFEKGGVVPRQGYQTVGRVTPDDGAPADYSPEADLPSPRAQEAGLAPDHVIMNKVPEEYRPYYQEASQRTGIPVHYLVAKDMQESKLDPRATGRAGEIGIAQVMPSTARDPGFGVAPVEPSQLRDPRTAINFGADYLAGRGTSAGVKDWSDPTQVAKALRAYNAGGDPNYVQNVFGHLGMGEEQGGPPRPPRGVGRTAEGNGLGAGKPAGFFDGIGMNKQTILPLLQGIGAMASSKSISPWAAALQGLGAGAKAYGDVEAQQAGIEQTRAGTPGIALQSAQKAIFVDPNGATWINIPGKGWVQKSDWRDMGSPSPTGSKMADYYLEKILPGQSRPSTGEQKPVRPTGEVGAQSSETGASSTAGKSPSAAPIVPPIELTNPNIVQPRGVGSQIADQEARDIERIDYGPDRTRRTTANEAALLDARKAAQGARELKPSLNALSLPLSNLAAGDQITPGALASLQTSLVKNVDAALDRVGLSQYKLAPQGLTDVQLADKAQALLTQARTLGLDQRAVSALDKVATSIANRDMTKEAAAEILASAYTDNMRLQHESSYALKYAEGKSVPVAQRASEAYRAQHPDIDRQFNLEKMAIKDLLLTKTQNGEALVNYLVGQGKDEELKKKITPDLINKKYGVNVSKYFLN